ncbi:MAG: DNA-binding NarL/FixJ family response regulator [Crocinitomicaceae bacterium]|jgi:DNA-binding NarL/FixJ family response regulator
MKQIKIAIADDHLLFLDGLSRLLSAIDYLDVQIQANNGMELMTQLSESPAIDVVLLDLDMPEMDGIEALSLLQEKYPNIKVIILSMHKEEAFILYLIQKGAHGYLLKNSSFDEVLIAINRTVEFGHYYDDLIVDIMRRGLQLKNRKSVSIGQGVHFTERELEVINLICRECTAAEISEKLFISIRTVEGHKKNLLQKTNSKNMVGLILACIKNKVISIDDLLLLYSS